DRFGNTAAEPIVIDRARIVALPFFLLGFLFLLFGAELRAPAFEPPARGARQRLIERFQIAARVADDADGGRPVLADLVRIAIDLDDLGVLIDGRAVANAEIERRAHDEHAIGPTERDLARQIEPLRMRRWQRAAAERVRVHRNAVALGDRAQR